MSDIKSSSMKEASQQLPAAPRPSKRELAALISGAKVNLCLGQAPNAELLFPVPRALLSKFSPTWRAQLAAGPARTLYVPRSFSKEPIKFVIEWMAAGNTYSTAKGSVPYPKDDLVNLVCLNQLAIHLEIDRLKEETIKSIDLYTQRQRMDLKTIDRLSKKPDVSLEAMAIVKLNLRKVIRGPKKQTWSEEAEEHPGRFQAGLSFLAALAKDVAEEDKARRKARLSGNKRQHTHEQLAAAKSAAGGNTLAGTPAANGRGRSKGGPNTFKEWNKAKRGRNNGFGSQTASHSSAILFSAKAAQNHRTAAANRFCFNCEQSDHTRPYCSNPRVFLGNCYLCAQQGHRAVECPTKAVAKKEEMQKSELNSHERNVGHKNKKASAPNNVRQSIESGLPPMVAKIVFVKDEETTSSKGKATGNARALSSPCGSVSSASTLLKETPRTSPETSPPTTKPAEKTKSTKQADKAAKQEDKRAEQNEQPKVYRFVTKKVRALDIAADGSVHRELIPSGQTKVNAS